MSQCCVAGLGLIHTHSKWNGAYSSMAVAHCHDQYDMARFANVLADPLKLVLPRHSSRNMPCIAWLLCSYGLNLAHAQVWRMYGPCASRMHSPGILMVRNAPVLSVCWVSDRWLTCAVCIYKTAQQTAQPHGNLPMPLVPGSVVVFLCHPKLA